MIILVLNAGSSSQKGCLYHIKGLLPATPLNPLWEAHLDWTVAQNKGVLKVKSNGIESETEIDARDTALAILLNTLVTGATQVLGSLNEIDVVAHRVVHGGQQYHSPTLISPEVKQAIADCIPLAPNHNPAHLEEIKAIESRLPKVPQVAVFDTAFHTTIPEAAKVYPLPYQYYQQGIQRYGFHGISHEYCGNRSAQVLQQPLEDLRIVVCHLGNGCSLAAIQKGHCIDTTMGFSPLEGLMMGTRCGSIDPQIPLYLMQQYGLDAAEIHQILNQESGLKGVSGISADLRTILTARTQGDPQAQLAFDIYIHRLKAAIAAMVSSLNGLDVLVFTAGIGENSSIVREKTCEGLSYLGVELDLEKNNTALKDIEISTKESAVKVLIIQTQEDWAIAAATYKLVTSSRR